MTRIWQILGVVGVVLVFASWLLIVLVWWPQ